MYCEKGNNVTAKSAGPYHFAKSLSLTRIKLFAIFHMTVQLNLLETTSIKRPSGLTLSQTTNFRLFQTENVCKLQFQIC